MKKYIIFIDWLNIIKMSILPKLTYKFSAITIKILGFYFVKKLMMILKYIKTCKGSRTGKALRKRSGIAKNLLKDYLIIF